MVWIHRLALQLLLCQVFCDPSSAQQCGREYSDFGMTLKKHIFKTIKTATSPECIQACSEDVRCQSFNYVISQYMCELNNRTKEARPEDFVPDSDRYYYGRVRKRGKIPRKLVLIVTVIWYKLVYVLEVRNGKSIIFL